MRKSKVILDFIKFIDAVKAEFYLNVIAKLTGNVYFLVPDVPLADAVLVVNKMQAAIIAAEDGGYTAKSRLNDVILEADLIFTRLAHYVDRLANGDETKILSSGFHESKQPVLYNKPALAVLDGDHLGSVKLVGKQDPRGRACIWQMFKGAQLPENAIWITIATTTSATYVHEGLESAQYYFFRMAIVTPDGTTEFCDPVRKLVI